MDILLHWDEYLSSHFPGYLLPENLRQRIERREAACFLERLTGRPHQLNLLLSSSLLAAHKEALMEFIGRDMPLLVRNLANQSKLYYRVWDGGYSGLVDIPRTMAYRLSGIPDIFVTRARHRGIDTPEIVILKSVAQCLWAVFAELRAAEMLGGGNWAADAAGCEEQLRQVLESTLLRDVPALELQDSPWTVHGIASKPIYAVVLRWYRLLKETLFLRDPEALSRLLAEGALAPLKSSTRFEIAVLLRLLQCLWERLSARTSERWDFKRLLVIRGREEVAAFVRSDGAAVRIYYNQSILRSARRDEGCRYYLGRKGRLRPDITIEVVRPGSEARAVVVEVKESSDLAYLSEAYEEALLYRYEYARQLLEWPKAILVTSRRLSVPPRRSDDVVAIGWEQWAPTNVVDALLEGV